jgi:hypothetical protein
MTCVSNAVPSGPLATKTLWRLVCTSARRSGSPNRGTGTLNDDGYCRAGAPPTRSAAVPGA